MHAPSLFVSLLGIPFFDVVVQKRASNIKLQQRMNRKGIVEHRIKQSREALTSTLCNGIQYSAIQYNAL